MTAALATLATADTVANVLPMIIVPATIAGLLRQLGRTHRRWLAGGGRFPVPSQEANDSGWRHGNT